MIRLLGDPTVWWVRDPGQARHPSDCGGLIPPFFAPPTASRPLAAATPSSAQRTSDIFDLNSLGCVTNLAKPSPVPEIVTMSPGRMGWVS
jgi:hypothetical protein